MQQKSTPGALVCAQSRLRPLPVRASPPCPLRLRLTGVNYGSITAQVMLPGGGGSGTAGAEFWGADPRPTGRERIGASATRRLKEESNARRSAEKERGRRDERLGDAPPPSFILLPSPPGSPPPPPPPLHPFTKLFSSPAFLFLLGFPSSPHFPLFKQRHFFYLNPEKVSNLKLNSNRW